jgi:hypothetical protein
MTPQPLNGKEGDVTRNTPGFPDGLTIGTGQMRLSSDDTRHIQTASIPITAAIEAEQARPVGLEEWTHSPGFLFDIENPFCEGCVDPLAGQPRNQFHPRAGSCHVADALSF